MGDVDNNDDDGDYGDKWKFAKINTADSTTTQLTTCYPRDTLTSQGFYVIHFISLCIDVVMTIILKLFPLISLYSSSSCHQIMLSPLSAMDRIATMVSQSKNTKSMHVTQPLKTTCFSNTHHTRFKLQGLVYMKFRNFLVFKWSYSCFSPVNTTL